MFIFQILVCIEIRCQNKETTTCISQLRNFKFIVIQKFAVKIKTQNLVLRSDVFFTDKTIIAIPMQNTLSQVEKFKILNKRRNILGKVEKYIDNNLDPNSKNFSNDLLIQESK